ncbi:MAG: hypothetical protein R2796_01575 [Chitinophagaceae bacterium]|nr:hypothetical protein [Chitinophagaceae bacterium]MCB0740026.1 hypothetical protein [Chitinophagaceae bacterium]HQV05416.1 hypothetical protein [Chitinophagaceae bacterium]
MMNVMNYQDYDVILDVFKAIEKENFDQAKEYFDGNFKSVILNKPVKAPEYLEVYRRIKEGMPDAKFEIVDLTSDGETFKAKLKIKGTHSQTMPALTKGWKNMRKTGKRINRVVTSVEILLRSDKIMEIRNIDPEKGVAAGLLDGLNLLPKSYARN